METWKAIPGHEGKYFVSSLGRVKNASGFIMSLSYTRGYQKVNLFKGKRITYPVHKLVAVAFVPNPEGKLCVNHKNGIKDDNRVENLEWATISENTRHAYQHGLIPSRRGNNNPNSHYRKQLKQNA